MEPLTNSFETDTDADGEEYVSVGLEGLLAATSKVAAVHRGDIPPDDRDAMQYKRLLPLNKLLKERVRLDTSHTRRRLMALASRRRTLQHVMPLAFNQEMTGQFIGNPLASPLEEINPMQLVQEAHRATHMGPGGIGSDDAITIDMQSVRAAQMGFISPLEGPECYDHLSEVYTKRGWTPWPEVRDDDVFACRVEGRLEWHKAERVVRDHYKGTLIVGEHETIRLAVTPGHRVINTRDVHYRIDTAQEVFGKSVKVPIRHAPYAGDVTMRTFQLPEVDKTNHNQKRFEPFDIVDWCALIGWWLAEGHSHKGNRRSSGGTSYVENKLGITQSPTANPEQWSEIDTLLKRMKLRRDTTQTCRQLLSFGGKQLTSYFAQWSDGCYDKWIPEDLFEAPVDARAAMLDALLKGDGRYNKKRWCYCTVSRRLAESVERLAITLGYTAFIREEKDAREHVKTTNWVVSIHRQQHRQLMQPTYVDARYDRNYGNNWRTEDYDGLVYCATVPGGLLHVRGKKSTSGHWSGNSNRAGIDVRLAAGARIGSDGKLYQRYRNRKTGKHHWLSHEQAAQTTIKLPD